MSYANISQNPFGLNYNNFYIHSDRLIIRNLQYADCAQWLKIRNENYHYLQAKEPIWDMDSATYQGFFRLIHNLQSSFSIGNYYLFAITLKHTREIIGGLEISNILSWPKQSASIGYWIGKNYTNLGFATEVVKSATQYAFQAFDLVKFEAGTLESNLSSQRVLLKCGFQQEGLSKSYGEINAQYQDHILWGLTKP